MREAAVVVGVVVGVALVLAILAVLFSFGVFDVLDPHFAGRCTIVPGPPGPEDVAIDRATGIAYISSDDRRVQQHGANIPGQIYQLDLSQPDSVPEPLTGTEQIESFHPHGISLFRAANGQTSLFVINHAVPSQPRVGHSIEIFAIAERSLYHQESIANLLFRSPNDIAAVGSRQFYLTNDRGYLDGTALQLERIFGWANSDVVYFDGQVASVVLDGLTLANGIQFDPQTERIFITETRADALRIYRRSRADGALTLANGTQVGRGPDNIDIDENGNIWIATHPKVFKLIAHVDRPESLSPSRVVRLQADGTGLEEIYVGTGEEISAASVAAVYNGQMLLGTIFDAKLLRCRLPDYSE
jgi:arylesterase / paraoxonase